MTLPEIALFHKAKATFEAAARTLKHPDMLSHGDPRYLDLLGNIYRAAEVAIPLGEQPYLPERMRKVYTWCANCCMSALTNEELAQVLMPSENVVRRVGGY